MGLLITASFLQTTAALKLFFDRFTMHINLYLNYLLLYPLMGIRRGP